MGAGPEVGVQFLLSATGDEQVNAKLQAIAAEIETQQQAIATSYATAAASIGTNSEAVATALRSVGMSAEQTAAAIKIAFAGTPISTAIETDAVKAVATQEAAGASLVAVVESAQAKQVATIQSAIALQQEQLRTFHAKQLADLEAFQVEQAGVVQAGSAAQTAEQASAQAAQLAEVRAAQLQQVEAVRVAQAEQAESLRAFQAKKLEEFRAFQAAQAATLRESLAAQTAEQQAGQVAQDTVVKEGQVKQAADVRAGQASATESVVAGAAKRTEVAGAEVASEASIYGRIVAAFENAALSDEDFTRAVLGNIVALKLQGATAEEVAAKLTASGISAKSVAAALTEVYGAEAASVRAVGEAAVAATGQFVPSIEAQIAILRSEGLAIEEVRQALIRESFTAEEINAGMLNSYKERITQTTEQEVAGAAARMKVLEAGAERQIAVNEAAISADQARLAAVAKNAIAEVEIRIKAITSILIARKGAALTEENIEKGRTAIIEEVQNAQTQLERAAADVRVVIRADEDERKLALDRAAAAESLRIILASQKAAALAYTEVIRTQLLASGAVKELSAAQAIHLGLVNRTTSALRTLSNGISRAAAVTLNWLNGLGRMVVILFGANAGLGSTAAATATVAKKAATAQAAIVALKEAVAALNAVDITAAESSTALAAAQVKVADASKAATVAINATKTAGIGLASAVGGLAVATLAYAGYEAYAASKAIQFGQELYKVHEATGLSARTLSGLNVIARENGEELDSLAKMFARAGRNVDEGLVRPASEAGKVLRGLSKDAQDLAQLGLMSADQQVQWLAQHIRDLSNAGDRDVASQAVFGRGWTEISTILKDVAENGYENGINKAQKEHLLLTDAQLVQLHKLDVAWQDFKLSIKGWLVDAGVGAIKTFQDWSFNLQLLGEAITNVEKHVRDLADLMSNLPGINIAMAAVQALANAYNSTEEALAKLNPALAESLRLFSLWNLTGPLKYLRDFTAGLGDLYDRLIRTNAEIQHQTDLLNKAGAATLNYAATQATIEKAEKIATEQHISLTDALNMVVKGLDATHARFLRFMGDNKDAAASLEGLIAKLRDEVTADEEGNNKKRAALNQYNATLREISKFRDAELKKNIDAAVVDKEVTEAQALAKQHYLNELARIAPAADSAAEAVQRLTDKVKEEADAIAAAEAGPMRNAIRAHDAVRDAINREIYKLSDLGKLTPELFKKLADAAVQNEANRAARLKEIRAKEEEESEKLTIKLQNELAKQADAREKLARVVVEKSDEIVKASTAEMKATEEKAREAADIAAYTAAAEKGNVDKMIAAEVDLVRTQRDSQLRTVEAKGAEEAAYASWAETAANSNLIVATAERQRLESARGAAQTQLSVETDPAKITALQASIANLTLAIEDAERRQTTAINLTGQAMQNQATVAWNSGQRILAVDNLVEAKAQERANKEWERLRELEAREQTAFARQQARAAGYIAKLIDTVSALHNQEKAIMASDRGLEQLARDQEAATRGTYAHAAALEHLNKVLTENADREAKAHKMVKEAEIDTIEATTAGIVGLIAGKRAMAAVDAVYDTAKAIENYAKYAENHYLDGAYLAAAVKYTAAAVEMGLVAGGVGGGGSRGGGGAGASGGVAGGSTGPLAPGATGSQIPMTPLLTSIGGGPATPSGNIHVMVMGESAGAKYVAGLLNNYTQRQGGQLVASRAITPPRAGR